MEDMRRHLLEASGRTRMRSANAPSDPRTNGDGQLDTLDSTDFAVVANGSGRSEPVADGTLVRQAQAGSTEAFDLLLCRQRKLLLNRARRTILWANSVFCTMTGYTKTEVIGQNPRLLKSGKHDAGFFKQLWDTVLAGRVWRGEVTNRRKDGSLHDEEMTITPVQANGRRITHFIAVTEDILTSGYSRDVAGQDTAYFQRSRAQFLQKPYPSDVLLNIVRSCLDGGIVTAKSGKHGSAT